MNIFRLEQTKRMNESVSYHVRIDMITRKTDFYQLSVFPLHSLIFLVVQIDKNTGYKQNKVHFQ